ncbi:afadin [Episyrphus balteatus]|uniref:afadin n=1 Tax=Episyrphus balteatus TaxID=286459 RepID=UPI0024851DB4|nr:afadin [Episyrphus balteatus]
MASHKNMLDREAVRSVIQQWNANRLDLFALSEPDENLLFHGVMRFYFQDAGQKVATKCIRVASDATVADVIDNLIEKFRPDMRMLSVPNYALYEVHSNGDERKLNRDEKPLLVQLNWHIDDREGRFLLKNIDQKTAPIESNDTQFKRKLSKREKKEQKKKEKLQRQNWESVRNTENETHVAGKLYTELPETSFTRSISNPEAVMRRRRQQKLEKKLQQFRSKDGGPDTGGTLKIYGESLCQDVPYKTLLLSIRDCAQAVVREMLSKYGLDKTDPLHYCLVQVNCDGTEYILDDDECPLSILMNHPTSRGSIMFHVRRRPADSQPRRRKKKPNGNNSTSSDREGPVLVEVTHSGDSGRRIKLGSEPIEVGSANTNSLQLFGPSIQARHCLISLLDGVCTVTPLHADALTFVNGHHVTQPTILHNGSVVMIGRVASYRFLDSPSDGRFNLALSQSQLDSACLYESRLQTLSPMWNKEDGNSNASQTTEVERASNSNFNNNGMIDEYKKQMTIRSIQKHPKESDLHHETGGEQSLDCETKSISSLKSAESQNHDLRSQNKVTMMENQGQELILPAVLEFPEKHQEQFLKQILTDLDVNLPHFKLAPVYSLYLCARYRASTHYRPELQPTERAHKLTIFLHHVANLIYSIIQGQNTNARILAFWMANSSEFLHFLKSDRHISAFSIQAQEILAESVQTAFHNLVDCFRMELSQTLNQFLSETIDHDSAAGLVLTVLGSAMALLRRYRVNAALTIQLFSQLFHYINAICFNTIVSNSHMCTAEWGKLLTERLQLLEMWAERQGLELAADCHLAKINQCAQFLQSPKSSIEEIQKLTCSCFRLNSLQIAALLQQEKIPRNLVDSVIRMAESVADELTRADSREVRLEESPELHLVLLLPDDGFSCDVVRGIPSGLLDFLNPLQSAGICRLAAQPTSIGLWTVYMHQFNARSPSEMSSKLPQPEVQVIKLQKNSNGMGLSIVAAKGAGQEQLGIYIKSVVPGGAADADNRLQAGDQLLRVDGQSLVGITQEKAADYLVRTGPIVTLEVAKQGAIYHGLATLLQQSSPVVERGNRSQKENYMMDGSNDQLGSKHPLSKSVPILHHPNKPNFNFNSNSRLAQSYSNNEQGFYQNLSAYRVQNQSQPGIAERPPTDSRNSLTSNFSKPPMQQLTLPNSSQQQQQQQQQLLSNPNNMMNRPASAYYQGSTYANYMENTNNPPKLVTNPIMMSNDNLGQSIKSPPQNFSREVHSQNSLRMNQMLAPSMPNISDARTTSISPHIYNTGMLSSQSMQNVAMINQASNLADTQHSQQQQQRFPQSQQQLQQKNPNRFQPPSTGDKPIRSNHRTDAMHEMSSNQTLSNSNQKNIPQQQEQQYSPNAPLTLPKPSGSKYNLSAFSIASSRQQQLQSNIPNSQQQNMHAPHQNYQQQQQQQQPVVDEKPPLPPTTTHPLFKDNSQTSQGLKSVVNSTEPPQRGSYYPTNAASQSYQGHFAAAASNPWEREEREKEQEIRREQIRMWRDKQITNLSNLTHRYPQQEEQLKTLVLEREFERRAHEAEEQEDDSEPSFDKENDEEEKFRIQPSSIQLSNTDFRRTQQHSEIEQDTGFMENKDPGNKVKILKNDTQAPPLLQSRPPTIVQPKGILKNNRYDSSNLSITSSSTLPSKPNKMILDESQNNVETSMKGISKNMSNLTLDSDMNPTSMDHLITGDHLSHSPNKQQLPIRTMSPPSPPERNISYIVMSQKQQQQQQQSNNNTISSKNVFPSQQQQQLSEHPQQHNQYINKAFLKNMPSESLIDTPPSSHHNTLSSNSNNSLLILGRDIKRVSFHDEENNYLPFQQTPQVFANEPSSSSNDKIDMHSVFQIPSGVGDLSDVSMSMSNNEILQSPQTPEAADSWNLTIKSTPGVIGAQEVYRDPRQRRLAEQQHEKEQQRSSDSVPEKLSFKEKMKMFALESGEDQTPKDKLKISSAQRVIDAAH